MKALDWEAHHDDLCQIPSGVFPRIERLRLRGSMLALSAVCHNQLSSLLLADLTGVQFLLAGPCRSAVIVLEESEDLYDVRNHLASTPVHIPRLELVLASGVGSLQDVVNALLPISCSIVWLKFNTD